MEIIKIKPQGLCMGVAKAINMIQKTLQDETIPRPIYMLGNVVHNKHIISAFQHHNMIVLEGPNRLQMLEGITSGTVIFTAHGVSQDVKRLAKEKGLFVVDATCKDVTKTHRLIQDKIDAGYQVYFYGVKNHPETEGILGISKDIILVTENMNLEEITINPHKKNVLTTQTTMSYLDVIAFHKRLKAMIPNLELVEEVCNATRTRQTAIIEYQNKIDFLIVVGDPLSNNSRMLKDIGEKKANLPTIFVENIEGLKDVDLSKYARIGITAGASTPDVIVEEIISMLKSDKNDFKTKLKNNDYL
jgi:4-hydroxy-3-methylbut-2-enyl diphosphate reductase